MPNLLIDGDKAGSRVTEDKNAVFVDEIRSNGLNGDAPFRRPISDP
jgi:hypothetical protein